MKKFIVTLVFCLSFFSIYSQSIQNAEDIFGYKTIYVISSSGVHYGEIRYQAGYYYLLGDTEEDNLPEEYISIRLGMTGEEACNTLSELESLGDSTGTFLVCGLWNRITYIRSSGKGKRSLELRTEDVRGISYVLYYINYKKVKKILKEVK